MHIVNFSYLNHWLQYIFLFLPDNIVLRFRTTQLTSVTFDMEFFFAKRNTMCKFVQIRDIFFLKPPEIESRGDMLSSVRFLVCSS